MKFIKKHKVLFFFIICFILGFVTMPLFHSGYIKQLLKSYTTVKWYLHILLFIGTLLLTLILHELTHSLIFYIDGYENEALIFLFFVFYKFKGKWKIKIDFKLLAFGGGLAYPNLGTINNDLEFEKARKTMLRSLIAAPLFTLISGLVLFVTVIIFFYKIPVLLVISFYYFLFSMFFTMTSTLETEVIKGDFKAYKRVKNDAVFASLIIFQYTKISDFSYNVAKETLLTLPKGTDIIYLNYLSHVIEKQVFTDEFVDLDVYNFLYPYLSKSNFMKLLYKFDHFSIAQSLLLYFYKCNFKDNVNELLLLFEQRLDLLKVKEEQKDFLLKQTLHLLNKENNADYINCLDKMAGDDLFFIFRHIPSFVEDELNRNKGVIPFILKCDI